MSPFKSLLLFSLILFSQIGFGQVNKFDLGVEGGPSLIILRGNEILDSRHSPSIGFVGGLRFSYNFKRTFSLRTSVSYERKGSQFPLTVTDINGNSLGEITAHVNYDYITVPLLFQVAIGKKFQVYFNIGPYFGFLIKQENVARSQYGESRQDNTSLSKRFDTGLSNGIGISIPVKSRLAITVELRNNLGLYNTSGTAVVGGGSIMTNSTNLLIGLSYKLGVREDKAK